MKESDRVREKRKSDREGRRKVGTAAGTCLGVAFLLALSIRSLSNFSHEHYRAHHRQSRGRPAYRAPKEGGNHP